MRLRSHSADLRACGRHGHITYKPTEEALAERLQAETVNGTAWKCLRCEAYVEGEPKLAGPAADAPILLRGRALRDAFILRLLATERFVRGLLLLLLAYGVHYFAGAHDSIEQTLHKALPLLEPLGEQFHVNFADSPPVDFAEKVLAYDQTTLTLAFAALIGYAALNMTEGVGLWLLKRWGEYVAVVATSVFLPWEAYELAHGFTPLKAGLLLLNLAAVVYLLYSKRLFGLRGGHKAFEAERHAAAVLEVEAAALKKSGK